LTPQLDTIITEVTSVKRLSLRVDPLSKHLPLTNWTYGDTGFTVAKLAILMWRYRYLYDKDENMEFFKTTANLSYGQKCCDHTNLHSDLRL